MLLRRAIHNDTKFLAKMSKYLVTYQHIIAWLRCSNIDVMDYSLMVGVDQTKQELVIGMVGK